jgi:hypothetical protein
MRLLRLSPRAVLSRPWSVRAEAGFVALVLVAWQAIRIPLEGNMATSLAHAQAELRLERVLHIDVERAFMRAFDQPLVSDGFGWLYTNLHVPVLVCFLLLARMAAPQRYPLLRLTFALSYVPAAFIIGLYPVAPPRYLPELGGTPPSDTDLTATTSVLLHNTTAAVASQHFALALFIAIGAVWIWPRSRGARLVALYPAAVFVLILATANHYVLDCLVGTAALGLGALAAWSLVERPAADAVVPVTPVAASVAIGYALLAWSLESIAGLPTRPAVALALVIGLLLVSGVPQALRPAPATRS